MSGYSLQRDFREGVLSVRMWVFSVCDCTLVKPFTVFIPESFIKLLYLVYQFSL